MKRRFNIVLLAVGFLLLVATESETGASNVLGLGMTWNCSGTEGECNRREPRKRIPFPYPPGVIRRLGHVDLHKVVYRQDLQGKLHSGVINAIFVNASA